MTSESDNIVSYFNHKCKGEIVIPIISNKEDLKPIIAKQPMEKRQID